MRTQYHFRRSPQGLRAWSVHRLVAMSATLPRERVPLSAIRELDEPYWFGEPTKSITCRQIAEHTRLIRDCDLAFPVVLSSDGRVMDGIHRICKALVEGLSDIEVVRFRQDPDLMHHHLRQVPMLPRRHHSQRKTSPRPQTHRNPTL